jgi:hypothetical protein
MKILVIRVLVYVKLQSEIKEITFCNISCRKIFTGIFGEKQDMQRQRIVYAIVVIATIFTGLLVRIKSVWFPNVVNLYLGDILYAFMMFYIVSFIVPRKSDISRALITLFACFFVEFSQLYHSAWIDSIRTTLPGKLVLGSGFLWSDLAAYTVGIMLAYLMGNFVQIRRIAD